MRQVIIKSETGGHQAGTKYIWPLGMSALEFLIRSPTVEWVEDHRVASKMRPKQAPFQDSRGNSARVEGIVFPHPMDDELAAWWLRETVGGTVRCHSTGWWNKWLHVG